MLKSMLTALGSPDLRKKIGFTAFILFVYRLGAYVPVPGVNTAAIQSAINKNGSSLVGLLNLFAGGALTRFSGRSRSASCRTSPRASCCSC